MTLPLLISVPHAGLRVPDEVRRYCALTADHIRADADGGSEVIYSLESEVAAFVTTDVARSIVDVNRAEDDRRAYGVVKTHTCYGVPVYREFPPDALVETLLARYHRPYHARLSALAERARLGIDCHTMDAIGPALGPDPGRPRPLLCLGFAGGTCPEAQARALARCLESAFESRVALNHPFRGEHTVNAHRHELPWIQLEMARTNTWSNGERRARVLAALEAFAKTLV